MGIPNLGSLTLRERLAPAENPEMPPERSRRAVERGNKRQGSVRVEARESERDSTRVLGPHGPSRLPAT